MDLQCSWAEAVRAFALYNARNTSLGVLRPKPLSRRGPYAFCHSAWIYLSQQKRMWNHKVPLLPEYKVHSRLFSTCWNKNYQSTQARRLLNFPKIALTTENYRYLIFYNWHNWCNDLHALPLLLCLSLCTLSLSPLSPPVLVALPSLTTQSRHLWGEINSRITSLRFSASHIMYYRRTGRGWRT